MSSESTHGRKIAITGHGFDVTEKDIRVIFERFGPISEVIYIRNKETGKSKGFSFVVYKDHSSAQLAINSMHHECIFERRVSVMFARQHKTDDSPSYSPGLANKPHFHHHGVNPDHYRPLRRPQANDFFHPRHSLDPRFPFPPGFPPSRADINHSPPNRFHAPVPRPDSLPKEKSSEVIQDQEPPQHPLATPSSLSGASEQEDGEISSVSERERKNFEPLEDGEMPDTGTPTQKSLDPSDESSFRMRQHEHPSTPFSLSNWKIDAATEKLLENIIRIQGSVKIDSSEAQRVWAQGGLRKQVETTPPSVEAGPKPQGQPQEELAPLKSDAEPSKKEHDATLQPQTPVPRPSSWRQWSHDSGTPKEERWEHNANPPPEFFQERNIGQPVPPEGQRLLGHPIHDGRDWSPAGPMHRPDLRHILGPDMHLSDQNPGGYGFNSHPYPRPLQEPPSRPPPFSHGPHSRHVHFPPRHPHADHHYQSFPQQQQQQPMQMHNQPYMGAPGPHPGQEVLQTSPHMMDQPQGSFDAMSQHPHQPANNYYPPMAIQDPNNGYGMQYPRGGNSMDHDSNIGMQQPGSLQDPNQMHQGLGPQHQQQPMDARNQVMAGPDGYQISPATIAQATIAQAAVNSDQCQDLSRSKDPMTLMSRMYVGNLDPKQVTKEDLHETFSVYGRILDIKIHNHFAFIQFDNPFSCMDAIHTAQSNTIQGQQPKLQLAADGQRARNEMIFNGNTSSLPPDPKELPPNVPYPNPFRGQSGHLPTFLTVQPTPQPPVDTPVTPQAPFPHPAPSQMPVPGVQQSAGSQHQNIPNQPQTLLTPNLAPHLAQPQPPMVQPTQTQEATNAQINAQLLSTALGMDPTALATLLSSLPILAKAKEESENPQVSAAAKKKPHSEKESKKRKKREVEKHAKAKKLNELEGKKEKARKKEEELAKVRARLSGENPAVKENSSKLQERVKEKEKSKRKADPKHESKRAKHLAPEELLKKRSKQDSSKLKDHTKPRPDSKAYSAPSTSVETEKPEQMETSETAENQEKSTTGKPSHKTKLPHRSRHESKSHKKSHRSKSQKRTRGTESPASAPPSPTEREEIMDQYAYMYDMMSQNPMNQLMKDYHDYYVGIYGYDFSHWNSEYERFLEDFPMDEDTKEMLESMQTYNSYPYSYGRMGPGPGRPQDLGSEQTASMPQSSQGPEEPVAKEASHTPT